MAREITREYLESLIRGSHTDDWIDILSSKFPDHAKRYFAADYGRSDEYNVSKGISLTNRGYAFGLIEFILEVGPVPFFMKNPEIGKIDPSKGWVTGNFK